MPVLSWVEVPAASAATAGRKKKRAKLSHRDASAQEEGTLREAFAVAAGPHCSQVMLISMDPSSTRSGAAGAARLTDAGAVLSVLKGHSEVIYCVRVFTEPELSIVTCSLDGYICVWELWANRRSGYKLKKPKAGAAGWTCAAKLQLPGGERAHATKISSVGSVPARGIYVVEFTQQHVDKKAAIIRRRRDSPEWEFVVTLEVKEPDVVPYGHGARISSPVCVLNTCDIVAGYKTADTHHLAVWSLVMRGDGDSTTLRRDHYAADPAVGGVLEWGDNSLASWGDPATMVGCMSWDSGYSGPYHGTSPPCRLNHPMQFKSTNDVALPSGHTGMICAIEPLQGSDAGFATGSHDNTIRVWRKRELADWFCAATLSDGPPAPSAPGMTGLHPSLRELTGAGGIFQLAILPTGQICSPQANKLRIWAAVGDEADGEVYSVQSIAKSGHNESINTVTVLPGGQVVTGCMNTSGHTSENVSVQIWGVDGATVSGGGQLWSPQCSFRDNPNSVWGFQPGFTENSFIAKGGGGHRPSFVAVYARTPDGDQWSRTRILRYEYGSIGVACASGATGVAERVTLQSCSDQCGCDFERRRCSTRGRGLTLRIHRLRVRTHVE